MITPDQVIALATAMRGHGVKRLKTNDVEIELAAGMPQQRERFDLEQRKDDEAEQAKKRKGLVYGSSW